MTGTLAGDAAQVALAGPWSRHALHDDACDWPGTNCYVDLWIELLNALGLDPHAGLAPALALDFVDDQWTFFKYSLDDLHALYGIDVQELTVWRSVLEHTVTHVAAGRPLIVEVDAYYLPDTAGITYRTRHDKTSIVTQAIDREARTLSYFHNAGYYTLSGEDFDGVFTGQSAPDRLVPYVEVVRLDALVRHPTPELARRALDAARRHFARRPSTNPVRRFEQRIAADGAWLRDAGIETFHLYAFAVLRQCGAGFATGAAFLRWLAANAPGVDASAFAQTADDYATIGREAKAIQFGLARAVSRKRTVDFGESLGAMAECWDAAAARLERLLAG